METRHCLSILINSFMAAPDIVSLKPELYLHTNIADAEKICHRKKDTLNFPFLSVCRNGLPALAGPRNVNVD